MLRLFGPATREWFAGAFATPTAAQEGAWRAVAAGRHALVVAPTGSGKTLAAFLWALDRLAAEPKPDDPRRRCRVLYVSPLKALAVDVERNLRSPLAGIRQAAQRLGLPEPDVTVGIRSGDTPAEQRRRFQRTPPDVLITIQSAVVISVRRMSGHFVWASLAASPRSEARHLRRKDAPVRTPGSRLDVLGHNVGDTPGWWLT